MLGALIVVVAAVLVVTATPVDHEFRITATQIATIHDRIEVKEDVAGSNFVKHQ